MGHVLLAGGGEFGGAMAEPDRRAIVLAGGTESQIDIIPAAAAPDNNHHRAGSRGVQWFRNLGATQVVSRRLIDQMSANDATIAEPLSQARLIYLLGGFPAHLANSLTDTRSWHSMTQAYETGGVLGGSSAGAKGSEYRGAEEESGGVFPSHVRMIPMPDRGESARAEIFPFYRWSPC